MEINYDMFTGELSPTSIFTENVFNVNNTVITYYAIYEIQHFGVKVYDGEKQLIILDPNNP